MMVSRLKIYYFLKIESQFQNFVHKMNISLEEANDKKIIFKNKFE